jgi:hypothetical protein
LAELVRDFLPGNPGFLQQEPKSLLDWRCCLEVLHLKNIYSPVSEHGTYREYCPR